MQMSENPKLKAMHAPPRDHHSATYILGFLHAHMHACVYFCFQSLGDEKHAGPGQYGGTRRGPALSCPLWCGT